jgi:hypothetical protein
MLARTSRLGRPLSHLAGTKYSMGRLRPLQHPIGIDPEKLFGCPEAARPLSRTYGVV